MPSTKIAILALAAVAVLLQPSCAQKVVVKQKIGAFTGKSVDLDAARATWDKIQTGKASAADLKEYNEAVDSLVVKLAGKRMPKTGDDDIQLMTFSGVVTVKLDPGAKGDLDLRDHERMYIADFTRIKKGLKNGRAFTPGIGSPLALSVAPNESDPFIAKEGLWRPATAILEFNGSSEKPKLVVYDPLLRNSISFAGKKFTLESDFTVPLAAGLAERDDQTISLPALLNFEKFDSKLGLIRLTPFDPKKTPCLLVHGLKSSPATWKDALNKILADPVLREEYEFWSFGYPTGAPIPFSAMRLRKDIARMHEFRRQNGSSDHDLLVVSHSMGGLLSKTLTQTSGDENWSKIFTKSVDTIDLPDDEREVLRDMFYFSPDPSVKRLVFIATPHKGSSIASNPVGAIASTLIDLPQQLISIATHILTHSDDGLTEMGHHYLHELPTSIDSLRPDSPMLEILNEMPLSPTVKYHSIIGNKKPGLPDEEKTDSVVPFLSASIDGVVSEKLIEPSSHSVHRTEEGIEEIMRIMHLHLKE